MNIYALLFGGLIFRLINLNQSLWLDEAVQVWASRDLGIRDLLFQYLPGDFNPPLYHLLLHFWIKIFGDSELAVRIPSVIFGILSTLLLYKISNLYTIRHTLFASSLLAVAPLHIYYSQEARMYSLACLTVLLVVWRFLLWQKTCLPAGREKSFKNGLILSASLVLMGFSHYLTFLILPVLWLATEPRYFKQLGLIHLPVICFYLVYSAIFFQQIKIGMEIQTVSPVWGKTIGSFSFKAAALLPVKFIIGRISITNKIVYGLISGVLVTVFWGLVFLGISKKFSPFFTLLLFLPPVLAFLVSFFVPVFAYFRFLFCLPFFYLLISKGLERIARRRLVIIFLIGTNVLCSLVYLLNPDFHREDWRGAVKWLHTQAKAPVLVLPQISKPLEYYDQGESEVFFWPNDQEKMKKHDKMWLVEYALPIFDPKEEVKGNLLEEGFVLTRQKSFRGLFLSFWQKEVYAFRD